MQTTSNLVIVGREGLHRDFWAVLKKSRQQVFYFVGSPLPRDDQLEILRVESVKKPGLKWREHKKGLAPKARPGMCFRVSERIPEN